MGPKKIKHWRWYHYELGNKCYRVLARRLPSTETFPKGVGGWKFEVLDFYVGWMDYPGLIGWTVLQHAKYLGSRLCEKQTYVSKNLK